MEATRSAAAAVATGTWHELNGYQTVTDAGKPKYVSADDQRKDYRDAFIRTVNGRSDLNPEQKMAAIFDFAQKTGGEIPAWTELLSQSQITAGPEAITRKDGAMPPILSDGLKLYTELYARNRRVLARHLKDPGTEDFWEAARVFKLSGMDDRAALLEANRVTQTTGQGDIPALSMDDITKSVRNLKDSWLPFVGDGEAKNYEVVAPLVRDMANLYRRAGMGKDEAVKAALGRIDASYDMINGWLVYTADKNVPPDFKDLVQDKLSAYFTAHAKEEDIGSPKELAIVPMGNSPGAFTIWNTKTGHPVEASDRYLTLSDLPGLRVEKRAAERQRVLQEADQKAKERAQHDALPWPLRDRGPIYP
jgi:hypothetical protein